MEDLLVRVVVPAGISLVVVATGYYTNLRLGIAPGQRILVSTLQDTVRAMNDRMAALTADFEKCKVRLARVEALNDELEQTVDDLRAEVRQNRTKA